MKRRKHKLIVTVRFTRPVTAKRACVLTDNLLGEFTPDDSTGAWVVRIHRRKRRGKR